MSVRQLSQNSEPLRLLGSVSSRSEANIRTESQGRITSVRVKEGDRVGRGQTLATIENSAQGAAVDQARAALASAEAAIDKSQTLTKVGLENAERNLSESRVSALNTLRTTLNQVDDAVRGQADTLFSNADTINPKLLFIISSNQQSKELLEIERQEVGRILSDWEIFVSGLTTEDINVGTINQVEEYAETVRGFLSNLVTAASSLRSSEDLSDVQISAWKGTASGARSILNGVIANLGSVRNIIIQAETGLEVAQEENSQSELSGNTTAEATVAQAQSALRSAEIGLSKTVISAPISGVVTRFDIETGDFVSILEPVAQISNDKNLEVVTYVTEEEKAVISKGAKVFIGSERVEGEVTQVAPTIDSSTQKIEVKIAPVKDSSLIDGQSVQIAIERSEENPDQILIPLSALKVLPSGFVAFVVNDEGVVDSLDIEVGPVVGDRVLVYSGLSLDTEIIKDARGISVGDEATINSVTE